MYYLRRVMALFTWNDEYSVGVQSIDKQHKKLFGMVNELHDAMSAGKGSQLAPAIIERLANYAQEHFAHEEDMMKLAKYPDFANHRAEHDKLVGEVARMARGIGDGSVGLAMRLQEFLCNWLKTHIAQRDKKYRGHLQVAGIR
jgi:hemerythrin-like metal-binding protein